MPTKSKTGGKKGFDLDGILGMVQDELGKAGIDVDLAGEASTWEWPKGDSRVKVVAVAPGLKNSVEEMSKTPRD